MRIVYVGKHGNRMSDNTEGHITRALESFGHNVLRIHEDNVFAEDFESYDMLLFHKGGKKIREILKVAKCKKVCWYFDKIWDLRIKWFNDIYPLTDTIFMTDGTWAKQYPKCKVLRQGIGNGFVGNKKEINSEVGFIGSLYKDRIQWFKDLKDKFDIHNYFGYYNDDLNDLCASLKIIVAPDFPSDNDYWSNRVYLLVGSGGFLIHPYLRGLYEEWGDNLVYYKSTEELHQKIQYYLDNPSELEVMRRKGYNLCNSKFTYKDRVKELLNICQNQ